MSKQNEYCAEIESTLLNTERDKVRKLVSYIDDRDRQHAIDESKIEKLFELCEKLIGNAEGYKQYIDSFIQCDSNNMDRYCHSRECCDDPEHYIVRGIDELQSDKLYQEILKEIGND